MKKENRSERKYNELKSCLNPDLIPNHVAVIMDGNGRWAKKKGAGRLFGHKSGAEAVRAVVETSVDIGIKYLTVYAFSTENWSRPEDEVSGLLKLILDSLINEIEELSQNNIVVRFLGTKHNLTEEYQERIKKECAKTYQNTGLNFYVAMNYGGRTEILEALKAMIPEIKNGKFTAENITEADFASFLYTAGVPDPDLLIRTSGEKRLSNYLIWQSAYTELYFTDILWPDFKKEAFLEAILDYQNRKRRFGGL